MTIHHPLVVFLKKQGCVILRVIDNVIEFVTPNGLDGRITRVSSSDWRESIDGEEVRHDSLISLKAAW